MMVIENKFELGQTVFLKTDSEQKKRIVCELIISPNGLRYNLSCGTTDSWHYEIEVCEEYNILVAITN